MCRFRFYGNFVALFCRRRRYIMVSFSDYHYFQVAAVVFFCFLFFRSVQKLCCNFLFRYCFVVSLVYALLSPWIIQWEKFSNVIVVS